MPPRTRQEPADGSPPQPEPDAPDTQDAWSDEDPWERAVESFFDWLASDDD